MFMATLTVLIGLLGTSLANPVNVEHNPWGDSGACRDYFAITDTVEACRGDIFTVPSLDGEATVSANTLRTEVAQPCSPGILEPYIQCVSDRTALCTAEDRSVIMAEAQAYYGRCDDQHTVASWIYDYALQNFSHVEPNCISYRLMCVNLPVQLSFPDITTPIADALQIFRSNIGILLDCAMVGSVELSRSAGCTASWQDVFFTVLIDLTKNARFGVRMYPELIEKIKKVRES